MDDDLQHPPEEIPRLLDELKQGCDVVYGAPKEETARIYARSCVPHYPPRAGSAIGMDLAKNVSAFRVFRTQLRDAFAEYQTPSVSIDVLPHRGRQRASLAIAHRFPAAPFGVVELHFH